MIEAVTRVMRYRLTAGACGLLAAYLVLALAAAQQQFLPLDRSVRAWVQPMRSGWLDLSMADGLVPRASRPGSSR